MKIKRQLGIPIIEPLFYLFSHLINLQCLQNIIGLKRGMFKKLECYIFRFKALHMGVMQNLIYITIKLLHFTTKHIHRPIFKGTEHIQFA